MGTTSTALHRDNALFFIMPSVVGLVVVVAVVVVVE